MKYVLLILALLFSTASHSADFSVIRQYVFPIYVNIPNLKFKPTATIKREVITVGSGSGVLIQQGYMLTAGHVAVHSDQKTTILLVPLSGRKLVKATVIKYDKLKDLALLSVPVLNCPCAHISLVNPNTDDLVYAVGFPMYEILQNQILTPGYIQQPSPRGLLVSSSHITFGSSGGGLFGDKSTNYALLGITDEIFVSGTPEAKKTNVEHDWINFSVSAKNIIEFLKGTPAEINVNTTSPAQLK